MRVGDTGEGEDWRENSGNTNSSVGPPFAGLGLWADPDVGSQALVQREVDSTRPQKKSETLLRRNVLKYIRRRLDRE